MATKVYRNGDFITLVLPDKTVVNILVDDFDFVINKTTGRVTLLDTFTPLAYKERGRNLQEKSGLEIGSSDQIEFYLNIITGVGVGTVSDAKGIISEFLNPRGDVGTAGWGDVGFIVDTPVVLLAKNSTEKVVYPFFAKAKFLFNNIDPQVAFLFYSTSAPVLTTGDVISILVEVSYFKIGDDQANLPDETFLDTVQLTFTDANRWQGVMAFTLDRTLITTGDVIQFTLYRLGGDAADNYNADVGIGQSGIILESLIFNP